MKIIREFPRKVNRIENAWIPMADGIHLAARLWIPEGAEDDPVPAIFEYIPYRKRDHTRSRDDMNHGYFAGHGYGCVRVDIRGSGDSEGVLEDEYLPQELEDGLAILRWIADQPWCDGSVGMIGISWGGFNGLQIAAMAPPQLKAVVTVCSTDDRYADDVHYMGGCLLGDNLSWASVMFSRNALPPDPEIVGKERWRDLWLRRLDGSGLWLEKWLRHQTRDPYWCHGSVCQEITAIQCPVMAVSGWADGYSNAVFRLMERLTVPRKGLVGPWSHKYPHDGKPGPAIGFLQECLRWWDQWLKGKETGIMDEPMVRAYMLDSVPPVSRYDLRPGRWVAEDGWPPEGIEARRFRLAPMRLVAGDEPVPPETLTFRSPLRLGLFAGKWCSYAAPPDLPGDQREEDGGALVFETEPLAEDLEILGAPLADLELSSDRPVAMVAARLSDVLPDGRATRVTYGILNLTHRESHAEPEPLDPGKRYRIRLQLNDIAQRFPKGHRLRLSLSTSYWPLAWPPPLRTNLTLHTGESALTLPVRPPRPSDADPPPFPEPESAAPLRQTMLSAPEEAWRVVRDLAEDISTLEVVKDDGRYRIEEIDLEVRGRLTETYTIQDDDIDSARGETWAVREYVRGDWRPRTVTRTILTSTATEFHIHATLDAYEGDRRVFSRDWNTRIPRELV